MRDDNIKSLMRECSAYITEKTKEIYTLVPGSGNVDGKIMIIGSSPTAKEEATGVFLEGKPSEKFDVFIEAAGLTREDLYMTYAVKYRPYTINDKTGRIVHRDVSVDEVDLFRGYVAREIEIIRPRLIVTLGEMAYKAVAGTSATVDEVLGKKAAIAVDEIIYDVMPLPHPKERVFTKITARVETIKGMNVQVGSIDYTTPEYDEAAYVAPSYQEPAYEEESNTTANYDRTMVETLTKALDEPKTVVKEAAYEMIQPSKKLAATRRKKRSASSKKKIIVVYGGTNLADDPTYVAVDRLSSVFMELSVTIRRIDLYKNDYSIDAFIDELEDADGVMLATTVEWYGIGGLLQTFLDKCYASRRFEVFSGAYLFGVVVSRQSYERDAYMHLVKSWEILGGVEGTSLITSIENSADLETDNELLLVVDKKAEDYYRVINQQRLVLPTSIHENKILFKVPVNVRVDEGEQMMMKQVVASDQSESTLENQMSFISNYDEFIEKQQKDIEDISSLFKERLTTKSDIISKTFPEIFEYKYKPDKTFSDCNISWVVTDRSSESFLLEFKGARLKAKFGKKQGGDVVMSSSFEVLNKITEGKLTVQRAFMTGEIKAKGNFTLLYKLDQLFAF